MASMYFRFGAMNCGKTTALLQVAHNYEEKGFSVVVIKPSVDTKGKDTVVSRLGISREVEYKIAPTDSLWPLGETFKNKAISCILVDEAQFLTETQVIELYKISKIYDIPVICYGLRTNFMGKGFQGSQALLLWADNLEELVTICTCGKKAKFQARKINGNYVMEGEDIVIDGSLPNVEYEPLCGECYIKIHEQCKTKTKKK